MGLQSDSRRMDGEGGVSFVNLRVHSAFSLLEGALSIAKIVDFAVTDGMPAVGIADTDNMFGALDFAQKATKAGIQPIVGCQLPVSFDALQVPSANSDAERPLVLIAASEEGYANLMRLVSRAYMESSDGKTVSVPHSWLGPASQGLICLTGGSRGPVGAIIQDNRQEARMRLEALHKLFGDRLYVELSRHTGYDGDIEAQTIGLAYDLGLPLVATNEAFFETAQDYEAHDALLAIADGALLSEDSRRRLNPDYCLKTQADMRALFADIPEAIDNTVEIARRCVFYPGKRDPILPKFVSASSAADAESAELRRQAHEGLELRLNSNGLNGGFTEEGYRERLEFELDVIEKMKFPGYFLIVSDFIKWAKQQGIPVGPGRGSGAGSLVAYALTITDIDPLQFSLLFERFLNPSRVSMPDFDVDFCQERRDEVIRYVQERYGRDQVAQIITFGSLQARAVLRDVGRVLEMPYGQVDRLCKLVPQNPANPVSLGKAIEIEPRFQDEIEREPIVSRMLGIAQKLEGLYRHASTHAAGIVIGDRPLSELVPLYRDPRSDMPVTQFNMKGVEHAGLVKFDFLGLKTLTVLKLAVDLLARRGVKIDLERLPLDDAETYALLSRGETVGIFQLESAGMRKALLGMRPDRIEDIIALVALYRPGPMENIPTYNARKHKEEEISSIHPMIDGILAETQGVIVYQEQVMQVAQILAGFSLGDADILRRAMGKKDQKEMAQKREDFVRGAERNGIDKARANTIFDLLAKFADYGFNKSHAAAYAVVSYQTAFLKAHYPVEFLAASMTYDMVNTEKLAEFRQDALHIGIDVVSPSVQTSNRIFEVGENRIFYSLNALKGVGEAAADHIATVRGQRAFASLEDFCERIDPKVVNRRVLESLINAGALDCFGHDRAALSAGTDRMLGLAQRLQAQSESGQSDIFGSGAATASEKIVLPKTAPWPVAERLMREHHAAGFYLSAHPLDEYKSVLDKMRIQNWADFSLAVKKGAAAGRLAGTVISKQERRTKTGNKMGIIQFSDATGQFEGVLFSEMLATYRDLLEPGRSFVITATAEDRPEGISLRISTMHTLEEEAGKQQKSLRVFLRDERPVIALSPFFASKGEDTASFIIIQQNGKREVEIVLPNRYKLTPQSAAAMKAVPGVVDVELV
jgi:DNA polymerase III subunit alpha